MRSSQVVLVSMLVGAVSATALIIIHNDAETKPMERPITYDIGTPLAVTAPPPTTTTSTTAATTTTKVTYARVATTQRASRSGHRPNLVALRWCENKKQCQLGNCYVSAPGDRFRGAYQFDSGTWHSVGGSGDPAAASPSEQDARAEALYARSGRKPWPVCGVLL